MSGDNEALYRALVSRDTRFDGRFFVGVRSTGIYCRPVCPAPNPKRVNCEFFRSAAEAESQGFRPCKRCRPESAPLSPAWSGTSTTVRRALRLIGSGALDEGTMDSLSDRLGVTSRHLRRLFDKHLGVSPLTVASTQRLHLARQLLTETPMSITDVGVAAGFGSLRRFNSAFKAAYGVPPSALRQGTRPLNGVNPPPMTIALSFVQPFDWETMLAFLSKRAAPGIEHCDKRGYARSFEVDGTPGVLRIGAEAEGGALRAEIRFSGAASILPIVERTRGLLDVDADMPNIEAALAEDPTLKQLIAQAPGLRVAGAWDPFELAVRAILGQQVTVAAARTLTARLCRQFGRRMHAVETEHLTHLFPTADALAEGEIEAIGIPRRRADTVRALARHVAAGSVSLSDGAVLEDVEAELLDIPGIGPWTVGYVRMRAFKDPDAFPTGDIALKKAAGLLGIASNDAALARASDRWRPWRAYAVIHLWHSLAQLQGSKS